MLRAIFLDADAKPLAIRLRRFASIGALSLLFLCVTARADEDSRQALLDQAESLSAEGRNEDAVKAARDALADAEKGPGTGDLRIGYILVRLFHFYEKTGDVPYAEMEKRLSAIEPKDIDVWLALGAIYHEEDKPLEEEDALKKVLAFKPYDHEVQNQLINVYEDTARFEKEIPLLKEWIEETPENYQPHFLLARVYIHLGRPEEAKEAYAQARKTTQRTAQAYIDEGYFYLNSGQSARAKKAFENAIAVDTASPIGYHHMGSYLTDRRQYPDAEKYLRLALEKLEADPNANTNDILHTMDHLGVVLVAQGRHAEAAAVYLKGLKKTEPGGEFQLIMLDQLGRIYEAQGKIAQAEETYKRALTACRVKSACNSRHDGEALISLGRFYFRHGRRAEAANTLERAERDCEDLPIAPRINVLIQLTELYESLGDVSKRDELHARLLPLRQAMPFNPDFAKFEQDMAGIDAAEGRFPEAERHYRQEIEILDRSGYLEMEASALENLAGIYEKEGKRDANGAREKAKMLRARL